MGNSPTIHEPITHPFTDKAKRTVQGNEGEARQAALGPPGGDVVMIEHDANERRPYVPKALRKSAPRR